MRRSIVTLAAGSTGHRDYVATWTMTGYQITYHLGGGTVSGNPATYTAESDEFTLVNPTRPGYTFTGWTGTDLASPTLRVVVPTGTHGALTFTATWQAVSAGQPTTKVKPRKVVAKLSKRAKRTGNPGHVRVRIRPVAGRPAATGTVTVTFTGKVTRKVRGSTKTRTVRVRKRVTGKVRNGVVKVKLPSGLSAGTWKVVTRYRGDSQYQPQRAKTVRFRYRAMR